MENRRDFFALMGAAMAAGAVPVSGKVADDVLAGDQAQQMEHEFGVQQIYFQGETDQLEIFEAGNLRLNGGREPHPPHKHPEEEIMLVTEGHGEFWLDGKTTHIQPGSMLFCAADKLHGVKAAPDAALLFYYFKWKTK